METRRYFWIFDRASFDQIHLPEFSLLEAGLIVATIGGLACYLALIVFLDRRHKKKLKRRKQEAWLERWLEHARLSPGELARVDRLAGGATPEARIRLLEDTVRFETRIHDAVRAGEGNLGVTDKVRGKLRYGSDNLRAPVVSTRQLLPGDPVRMVVWEGGLPHHYYGRVAGSDPYRFSVLLRPEAVRGAVLGGSSLELFFLRAEGLEYRFSCRPGGAPAKPGELLLEHAMVSVAHLPRNARLPLLRPIPFRERSIGEENLGASQAGVPEPPEEKGLLLDLSEGGFSIAHGRPIPVGNFVEFSLPLKKGRLRPQLTGKVLECRPFSGGQWLSRCELRGVSGRDRDLLQQVVRLEQLNRMKVLAPVSRRASKKG